MIMGMMAGQMQGAGGGGGSAKPELRLPPGTGSTGPSTSHINNAASYAFAGDRVIVIVISGAPTTFTEPVGWAKLHFGTGASSSWIVYWRDWVDGGSAGNATSSGSVRTSFITISVKAGTFDPAVAPLSAAAYLASGAPNPPNLDMSSISTRPQLVIAAGCIDEIPTVSSYPLAYNNTFTPSTATPVCRVMACTGDYTAASADPAAFGVSISAEAYAATIAIAGFVP